MTDKELSKLRRAELLEMLIAQGKDYNALQARLAQAEEQLQSRELAVQQAGTMADAAFQLNDVIGAAQKAIDLYTENVNRLCKEQEEQSNQALSEAKAHAEQTRADAEARAQELLANARAQAEQIVQEANAQAKQTIAEANREAAQTQAEAKKEKKALLEDARKSAAEILKNARAKAGVKEEPAPEAPAKRRPFWKRNK